MGSLIFVIISCYLAAALIVFRLSNSLLQIKILLVGALITSSFSFGLPIIIPNLSNELMAWNRIISITLILTFLSVLIRECKPAYTRYPSIFVYLPMFTIIAYPFINDAQIVDNMLNILLQGGALLILFLLFMSVTQKMTDSYLFLIGLILMVLSYISYWFMPDMLDRFFWLWNTCFGTSMILISIRSPEVIQELMPIRV